MWEGKANSIIDLLFYVLCKGTGAPFPFPGSICGQGAYILCLVKFSV